MPEPERTGPDDLRRRAELAAQQARDGELPPSEQLPQAIHELQVHQIELEMQNESLRRARAELEFSRDRYADLYDFAPVGYLTLDPEGRIREINLTACFLLDRPRARLLGHPLVAYVDHGGKNALLDYLRRCRQAAEGEELVAEVTLVANPPVEARVRLCTVPARSSGSGEREYRVALVDVSELRRSERALRDSEEVLRLALEGGRMGTWDWDLQTGLTTWSESEFALFGLPPQDAPVPGDRFFERVHPDDRAELHRRVDEVLQRGNEFRHEFRILRADGQVRWLAGVARLHRGESGQPLRMVGVNFDITGRKRTEAELKQLNETLERQVAERTAALRLLHDVASMANRAQSVEEALRDCLKRVAEHCGWSFAHAFLPAADDPEGLLPAYVWYAADAQRFADFRELTLRTTLGRGECLPGRVYADGRPAWTTDIPDQLGPRRAELARKLGIATAAAFPVVVEDRVVGVLEYFSEKRLEPQPEILETMAGVGVQLGRVVEREALQDRLLTLAEAEHRRIGQELHDDVGQEMTGLALKAETLAESLRQQDHPEAELARRIVAATDDTRRKTRALARGLVPTEVHAPGLAAALEELALQVNEGRLASCRFHCRGEGRVADGRTATQLYRIAQEAVANALAHGGKSTLTLEISLQYDDEGTLLAIRDNGQGLPPEGIRGPGLGLQIMRYRAGLVGGILTVDSPPDGGTLVACRIPKT